jgi:hypothetical protein
MLWVDCSRFKLAFMELAFLEYLTMNSLNSVCHCSQWQLYVLVCLACILNLTAFMCCFCYVLFKFDRNATSISQDKLVKWCTSTCPKMLNGLHSYICGRLTEERGASSGVCIHIYHVYSYTSVYKPPNNVYSINVYIFAVRLHRSFLSWANVKLRMFVYQ